MARWNPTRKQRLIATIGVTFSFFVVEMSIGIYTHTLCLMADAFHMLSDLIGMVVALVAVILLEGSKPAPQAYTYGWHRATLLGSFFNGVFLLALGVSILIQAFERFAEPEFAKNPFWVLIVGSVGLGLNLLTLLLVHEHAHGFDHDHGHSHSHSHGRSKNNVHVHAHAVAQGHDKRQENHSIGSIKDHEAALLGRQPVVTKVADEQTTSESNSHETPSSARHRGHRHGSLRAASPGRDLGMLGVFYHIVGDAINNLGVIIAAVVMWQVDDARVRFVDPAVSVLIAVMIMCTAWPLARKSGAILLQMAPLEASSDSVKHDMEQVEGVESVHELHIWRLDQHKSILSAHVVVNGETIDDFMHTAKIIMECLHAYGIHSATLQPELLPRTSHTPIRSTGLAETQNPRGGQHACQLTCGSLCESLRCCTEPQTIRPEQSAV